MNKLFFCLLTAMLVAISACNMFSSYGKRIRINDSIEVYLKGDSITQEEGKKLGNYLAELWKENTNRKSMQLSKEKGIYVVKMVVNEQKYKEDPSMENVFMALHILLEQQVFKNQRVKLVLTDDSFKDIKTFDTSSFPNPQV